jgi:hypothetical protein
MLQKKKKSLHNFNDMYLTRTCVCFQLRLLHRLFPSGPELTAVLARLYGGFLPWAGDLLALLLLSDHDLLAMLRTLAIKFSQLGRPRALPAMRKVTSIESATMLSKTGDQSDCMIK